MLLPLCQINACLIFSLIFVRIHFFVKLAFIAFYSVRISIRNILKDVSEEKNLWNKILEGVNLPPNESGNGKRDAKGTIQSSPTMVFSMIGDSDSFVPRPWPKTVFQTALIEAAKSGGGMSLGSVRYSKQPHGYTGN